jgi:hypothetical protein
MQTASLGSGSEILVSTCPQGSRSLLLLYFAEIEKLNMSKSRSFYVEINGEKVSEIITLVPNYSTLELTFLVNEIYSFSVVKAPNSTLGPILNAFEYHWVYDTDQATYSQDRKCLTKLLVLKLQIYIYYHSMPNPVVP